MATIIGRTAAPCTRGSYTPGPKRRFNRNRVEAHGHARLDRLADGARAVLLRSDLVLLHPGDEGVDEVLQEFARVVVDDRAVGIDARWIMLHEDFGLAHGRHVEISEHVTQMLLRERAAHCTRRRSAHCARLAAPRAMTPRTRTPVDCVFQHAGHRAVVFGRHEQQGVGGLDLSFEVACRLGGIGVVLLAVQRQIADFDKFELEVSRCKRNQSMCELPVERFAAQAAYDDCDLKCHGVVPVKLRRLKVRPGNHSEIRELASGLWTSPWLRLLSTDFGENLVDKSTLFLASQACDRLANEQQKLPQSMHSDYKMARKCTATLLRTFSAVAHLARRKLHVAWATVGGAVSYGGLAA